MKRADINYRGLVWFCFSLLLVVPACTDHFDSLNTPKDTIVAREVDESFLGLAFASAQYYGMFGHTQAFQDSQANFADLYAQYFAITSAFFDVDQFVIPLAWINFPFDYFYENPAQQLLFVEQYTSDNNMAVENAIAKIWRVQIYHRITDYWGPIPYSNFGNYETSVPYDSQEVIYADFFKTLDEAIAVLEANQGTSAIFGHHDLVYSGNVDKWLKFANSLRLRLAMRTVYVDEQFAKDEAEKAVAGGVISANEDNAGVETTATSRNPYDIITAWGEYRMSAAMQSTLEGFDDPRLPVYYQEADLGGGYKGLRNGLDAQDKGGDIHVRYSNMGQKWAQGGENPPLPVMSAAEVYFLRAEGALRGWNMEGGEVDLYNLGIRLSLQQHTDATDSDINSYITSTNTPTPLNDQWSTPAMSDIPVVYQENAGFETRLEQIITQKWLALYPDSREAWAERRRTGYPRGIPIIRSQNPYIPEDGVVRRLLYTTNEYSNNTAAVEHAVNELLGGPDRADTRLWWDKKQ